MSSVQLLTTSRPKRCIDTGFSTWRPRNCFVPTVVGLKWAYLGSGRFFDLRRIIGRGTFGRLAGTRSSVAALSAKRGNWDATHHGWRALGVAVHRRLPLGAHRS